MDQTLVEVPEVLVIAASIGGVITSLSLLFHAVYQRRVARAIGAPPRVVIARIALRGGVVRTMCALGFLLAGVALTRLPPRPAPFGDVLIAVTYMFLLCAIAVLIASILDIRDRRRLVELISPRGEQVKSPPTPLAT